MSKDGICSFGNVQERDMDLMFMESLLTDDGFVWLFLNKAGIACNSVEVLNVALSETDPEYGESDITAILSIDGKKHALLIEDERKRKEVYENSRRLQREYEENGADEELINRQDEDAGKFMREHFAALNALEDFEGQEW